MAKAIRGRQREAEPGKDRADTRGQGTRERILDAAEHLFAEHGFNGVSTRAITEQAQANNAAMHYHFGSKEALIRAIFERRLGPINEERERLIAQVLNEASPPDLSRLLKAFIGPTLNLGRTAGERCFKILAGRASNDPSAEVRRTVFDFYDSVGRRFVDAAAKACPTLSKEELFWRMACVYGAMMYVRADNGRLQKIFGEDLSLSDPDAADKYMMPFLEAGLSLPPTEP